VRGCWQALATIVVSFPAHVLRRSSKLGRPCGPIGICGHVIVCSGTELSVVKRPIAPSFPPAERG
jgi:hypothetical protein